jgi:hypothetical protein
MGVETIGMFGSDTRICTQGGIAQLAKADMRMQIWGPNTKT